MHRQWAVFILRVAEDIISGLSRAIYSNVLGYCKEMAGLRCVKPFGHKDREHR